MPSRTQYSTTHGLLNDTCKYNIACHLINIPYSMALGVGRGEDATTCRFRVTRDTHPPAVLQHHPYPHCPALGDNNPAPTAARHHIASMPQNLLACWATHACPAHVPQSTGTALHLYDTRHMTP